MGKKITRKQLQQLVESKVDEAWGNNGGNFGNTVKTLAAATIIGTMASCGGNGNDTSYENDAQRQTMFSGFGNEGYEKWCQYYQRDPKDPSTQQAFDDWCNDMQDRKENGEDVYYYQQILKEGRNAKRKRGKVRLTESQLNFVIAESVKKILKENDEEEYNPWMNGDASWIAGSYDIPYGFHVEIDPSLSTVAIDGDSEENSYFLQGDEADDLIRQIAQHWSSGDMTQEEAVNDIIRGLF